MKRLNEILLKAGEIASAWLPDALMAGGAAAVAFGAGLVYLPDGFITGGSLAIAAGVLAARGAR